jgi:hemophore-related protein
MSLSVHNVRRGVIGVIGIGAIAGAMLCASATAAADQPNCTAADLAGVASGVASATSSYLFSRPDVNAFFTGLKGQPRDQIRGEVQDYLSSNPQVQADLQGIRQPLVDLRSRCQ